MGTASAGIREHPRRPVPPITLENQADSCQVFDSGHHRYYYRARYYDPQVGRFLGEDPIGFTDSVDFYTYTDNSPANWLDPLGLDRVQVCCRPLRFLPYLLLFRIWHHCYIQISGPDMNPPNQTWGVLPPQSGQQPPGQWPRHDDPRNGKGKCKDVPCPSCKIGKLKQKLDQSTSGGCPSCGSSYHNYWWRFDGNNSNTYVYNMVSTTCGNPPEEPRAPGYHPAPGW